MYAERRPPSRLIAGVRDEILGSQEARTQTPPEGEQELSVDVPETRYARRGDAHLAYQTVGQGGRDVFYLSYPLVPIDLMWDEPLLARGLRQLASVGRLITCDGRGWGSSDPVDQANVPALQTWMDDVGTVLDETGSSRAALVGWDLSTLPLMLFAASHPERVSALVLINAFARFSRDADYPWGLPAESLARWIAAYEREVGTGAISRLYAPSRADDPLYLRWANRAERLSTAPRIARGQYTVFAGSDLRGVLPSISAPTLVLHRSGDKVVRQGHAEYLASHILDARLVELSGEDHTWFGVDVDVLVGEIIAFLTGQAPSTPRHDRALATVAFIDIVASTEQAARAGDAKWRTVIERYHDVAAAHVASFRGRLIKSTGDGTLATFDGPARAIQCGCAVRDAVQALGLSVRVGLHTGEIELMGEDIGGIAVHIGARVTALAHPNEVLASAALPPLVVGSDVVFNDRGEHSLKGVPGTWRVFAVAGESTGGHHTR